MTDKPFAVNLTVLPTINPPPYGDYAQVILDEGIKIVETAGLVKEYVEKFKAAGCIVLHKCTTIRHSISAVKMGVDFLSIDGFECAGHVGEHDIPNFVLLNRAREQLVNPKTGKQVPYIASGGMANGASLAASLSLGACGINMGTRFMCTVEAPIHNNIKQAIVDASEDDTALLMRRWKNTARFYKNKVTDAAAKIEKESTTGKFEEIAEYVSGKRGRQVFLNGDKDYGVRFASIIPLFTLQRALSLSYVIVEAS
jgi:NAD(P)H-dependent flavin oxidoreductase YrpB (nitropropane dioxygenase family)